MPKGVTISHQGLACNILMMHKVIAVKENESTVCWLPTTTIAGIMGRLVGAVTGHLTVVFSPLQFIQNPILWLQVISRYRAIMSLAPCFAYALCSRAATPDNIKELDLSCFKIAVSGGEIIRKEILEQFCDVFACTGFSYESFYPYYGLTETLCISTTPNGSPDSCIISGKGVQQNIVSQKIDAENDKMIFISNGRPLDGITMKIVDPETKNPLPENRIGEIWVKSNMNTPAPRC